MTCFDHEFLDRFIEVFASNIFVANDAFCIDQIGGWPTGNVPFYGDGPKGTVFAVPETAPIDTQFFNPFTCGFDFFIAINSNQSKWFISQLLYERPLVWDQGPARTSPITPKANQHNLALVVTQFKFDTI